MTKQNKNTRLFLGFLLLAGLANFFSRNGLPWPDTLLTCINYLTFIGLLLFWIEAVRVRLLPSPARTSILTAAALMLLYMLLCFVIRLAWKDYLQRRLHIKNRTGLLVVAELNRLREVVTTLVNHNYNSYRFVGVALMDEGVSPSQGEWALKNIMQGNHEMGHLQIVASRDELMNYLVNNWVDEVYLDIPDGKEMPIDLVNNIMTMGITVHLAINNIDRIAPLKPTAYANITASTNQDVSVTATFSVDSVVKEYSLDIQTWKGYTAPLWFTENGSVYFRGTDAAGNISEVTGFTVGNIDKVAPEKPSACRPDTSAMPRMDTRAQTAFRPVSRSRKTSGDSRITMVGCM